jgi:lactate permease
VILYAWSPYFLLIGFVVVWSLTSVKNFLNGYAVTFGWPGLDGLVLQMTPVVAKPTTYAALYRFRWLAESGTACALSAFAAAAWLRVSPMRLVRMIGQTARQLALPLVSVTSVLALAFLMNYCGATATLGLAFANTGAAFPFFSPLLGWLGVFLTGSDTSSNALFGNLQHITALRLGLKPALMAAANSAGGVTGKMISLQSIAVAAAATGLPREDEPRLFRFTLRHSIFLAVMGGLLTLFYAYLAPGLAR